MNNGARGGSSRSAGNLRQLLLSPITRTRTLLTVFAAIVAAKGGTYWVASSLARPTDPASTIAIYRGKDIAVYPMIRALAELDLGEPNIFELRGSGLLAERFAPWVPYAIGFRVFGPFGFAAADIALTLLYYYALLTLLHRTGISTPVAGSAALALAASTTTNFGVRAVSIPGFVPLDLYFWGLRIPRPFFSESFGLLALYCLLSLTNRDTPTRWHAWAFLGATLAIVLQSDPFSAVTISLCTALYVSVLLANSRTRAAAARGVGLCAVAFALCSMPLFVQQLRAPPDLMLREGLFPISRSAPLFLPDGQYYVLEGLLLACSGLGLFGIRRLLADDDATIRVRGLCILSLLSVTGLFALPASCVVLGRGVQVYHFKDAFFRAFSLLVLVLALNVIDLLPALVCHVLRRRPEVASERVSLAMRGLVERIVVSAAVVLSLLSIVDYARAAPRYALHMRPEFPEWGSLTEYRSDFVALAQELSKEKYASDRVIGTFDHQVWSWWLTFQNGYSYLSDSLISTLNGDEIERRLMAFCKILGMDAEQFRQLISRNAIDIFWLGHDKYQASKAHTFTSLSDYNPKARQEIGRTTVLSSWNLAIPESEERRLLDKFQRVEPDGERLDLVILTKDEVSRNFEPRRGEFDLTYENSTFRVWKKRPRLQPQTQSATSAPERRH